MQKPESTQTYKPAKESIQAFRRLPRGLRQRVSDNSVLYQSSGAGEGVKVREAEEVLEEEEREEV